MNITFDPAKRAATLAHRGLDFADAARVFEGDHATWTSEQSDLGDVRLITAGWPNGGFRLDRARSEPSRHFDEALP